MTRADPITLDRMAVEEAGPNPASLAAAIHGQLVLRVGPVPVQAIAKALDIVEIRAAATQGLEGALVTTPERGEGVILVNAVSSPQRQRFTVAHELGHFLNVWHKPIVGSVAFACTEQDVATPWRMPPSHASRHFTQEAEASRFAIELLAPAHLVRPALTGIPDLAAVLALAGALEISREACARRSVELRDQPTAVVFSRDGVVRYVERAQSFPFVSLRKRDRLPALPRPVDASGLSNHEQADPQDWLAGSPREDLIVQMLQQQDGYAMTLLALDRTDLSLDEDE